MASRPARAPRPFVLSVVRVLCALLLAAALPALAQITISPTTLPDANQGAPYSTFVTASGGSAPYTYTSVLGHPLPPGLVFSAAGQISGTPTTPGVYTFNFGAFDDVAAYGESTLTLTVLGPPVVPFGSISMSDTSLRAGETATVTVTFNTAVTGLDVGDFSVGSGSFAGAPATGDGGVTWTVTYVPPANAAGGAAILLNNSGVTAVSGGMAGEGSSFGPEFSFNTIRPTATVVVADPLLLAGETSLLTITFSEAVTGLTTADLTVANASVSGLSSSDGGITWTATLAPSANVQDPSNLVTLDDSGVANTGGNSGSGSTDSNNYAIDTALPTAVISLSDADLRVGETATATFTFDAAVTGFDAADVTVENGTIDTPATADGGVSWTATLTPAAGVSDPTNALTLALAGVADANGQAGIGSASSANYAVETIVRNLTIDDVTQGEGNAGPTTFTFTVQLDAPAGAGGVTFDVATADGSTTAGEDYDALSTTGSIGAGGTSTTIVVTGNGDTFVETNETFDVILTNVVGATAVDGSGVGTINDDDVPVALTPSTLADGAVAAAYDVLLGATGGDGGPYTFALTAGSVPPGMSLAGNGSLQGTPTAAGTFAFTVTATDGTPAPGPNTGSQTYTLVVAAPTLALDPPTQTFTATYVTAFSQDFTASGGTGPYAYDFTGTAPAGMTFAGGTLSGSPTVHGTFPFSITATDSSTGTGAPFTTTVNYTLEIAEPLVTISPTTLPDATVDAPYTGQLVASGGDGTYAFWIASGTYPPGLTFNGGGAIGGTPTTAGSYTFTVEVADGNTYGTQQTYTLVVGVGPPIAGDVPLAVDYGSVDNTITPLLTGGPADSVAIATPPANGTAAPAPNPMQFVYTPAPGYAGTDSFTYTATNAAGTSAPATVSIVVFTPTLDVADSGPTTATIGQAYTRTLTWSGGAAPYTMDVAGLPAGLAVTGTTADTITFSGVPTTAGSFALNASVTDSSTGSGPFSSNRELAITVVAPTIVLAPGAQTFAAPYVTAFSQDFSASGGTGPYTFALTGTLPNGMAFAGGTLSGTPTQAGTFAITVTATDSSGGDGAPFSASVDYTVQVDTPTVAISPDTLPGATVNQTYSAQLVATGGNGIYNFWIASGNYPPGMDFNGGGALSGTPTLAGSYTFVVEVLDGNGYGTQREYTIDVAVGAPIAEDMDTTVLYGSGVNALSPPLSGGPADSLTIVQPPLRGTAAVNGLQLQYTPPPGFAGADPFTYSATNASGTSNAATINVTVSPPTLVATDGGPGSVVLGQAYSRTFTWSGGAAPYTMDVTGLPAGLGVTATTANSITIAGTPTATGAFALTATATDSSTGDGPFAASAEFALTVTSPVLTMTPASGVLVGGYDLLYGQAFAAAGGTAPYTYVLTGTLPAGLSFSNGTLAGTPTEPGTFDFSVTATDSSTGTGAPFTVSQSYQLQIEPPTIAVVPDTLPDGSVGSAYNQGVGANGGSAPYGFAVTGGALPAGLTMTAGGLISGTPTADEVATFSIIATDANGQTGERSYTLTIVVAPPLAGDVAATVAYNSVANPIALDIDGGGPAAMVAVTTLPANGTAVATGTTIAYTPNPGYIGVDTFAYTASNASGESAPATATITVTAPTITISPATLPSATRGQAFSAALAATGAAAPYTFAVTAGALPAGIVLAAGGDLAGTPTAAGGFAFTVTALDAFGQAGTRDYTLTVVDLAPVAVDDVASTLSTTPVLIPVTGNDTGDITGVAVASTPANGSLEIDGLAIFYIPNATFAGDDTFTYRAIGPGGESAAATVTVTVYAAPVAMSRTVQVEADTPITVELTEGATGGPFVDATLVEFNPAAAGTTSLASHAGSFALTYTPAAGFVGEAQAIFTLTNRAGEALVYSPAATITFVVAERADPTGDPDLQGLLDAQIESLRRFGTSQVNNFQQHMDDLHDGDGGGFDNGLGFSGGSDPCRPRQPSLRDLLGDCGDAFGLPAFAGEAAATGDGGGHGRGGGGPFGVWAAGVIRSGAMDGRAGGERIDFETDGLSAGIDRRFGPDFVLGAGLGWGRDDNAVGRRGSRVDGEAWTLAIYASWHPSRWYVDGMLGWQRVDYDLRRHDAGADVFAYGSRDGHQWLASLSAGAEFGDASLRVIPYGRLEVARAQLSAYTESGGPGVALHYEALDVDTSTANIGLRVEGRQEHPWGVLAPHLRIEYQHDLHGDTWAALRWADLPAGPFYELRSTGFDRSRFVFGLGARLDPGNGWNLRLEVRAQLGSDGQHESGVVLGVERSY